MNKHEQVIQRIVEAMEAGELLARGDGLGDERFRAYPEIILPILERAYPQGEQGGIDANGLKPCPCCGGKPQESGDAVECSKCGLEMNTFLDYEHNAAAWNHRAVVEG